MEICVHESIISSFFLLAVLLQILKAIQSFLQLPIAMIIQYTHSYLLHSPLLIFSVSFSIISSMGLFAYYINYKRGGGGIMIILKCRKPRFKVNLCESSYVFIKKLFQEGHCILL